MLASLPKELSRKTIEFLSTYQGDQQIVFSSRRSQTISSYESTAIDVLTGEDLLVGTFMALVVAFTVSFLQSRRSQNDFIFWENSLVNNPSCGQNITDSRVFDGEAWKEIARPENYVFYTRRLVKDIGKSNKSNGGVSRVEQTWVLAALLALFVPIFSVEFFFALSREVICEGGNPMSTPDWAAYLCSPADTW